MFALADRNPYTHDNHFRPQVAFMPPEGARVFRLEDGLDPVLSWLAALEGSTPPDAVAARSEDRSSVRVVPTAADQALIYRRYREITGASAMHRPEQAEVPDGSRFAAHHAVAAVLDPL